MRRNAFSLLEVILALALLAGSIAVLGEAARMAMRNAAAARDLSRAQLLCESKMAEILAGLTLPEAIDAAPLIPLSEEDEGGWLYSIAVEPTESEGLIAVRVTVGLDQPPENRPVRFSMTRWMMDPNFTAATETEETESAPIETGGEP